MARPAQKSNRLAAVFAAKLGPDWKSIGLFDSRQIPCGCVQSRCIADSTPVAYLEIERGVYIVRCAMCKGAWSVAYVAPPPKHGPMNLGAARPGDLRWYERRAA